MKVPETKSSTASYNLLNSVNTGGSAALVQYACYNGATPYNNDNYVPDPSSSWIPPAALFDEAPHTNDENFSYRSHPACGSTWASPSNGAGVGVLVIDMTQSTTVTINKFVFFQMASDGAVSSLKISYHPSTSDNAPKYQTEFVMEKLNQN